LICLTGDVHHMSMRSTDQGHLKGTEVDASLRYMEIAESFGVKATLFVTGKCVREETDSLVKLSENKALEIGGHNYNAFRPLLPYQASGVLLKRKNGPAFVQKRDIAKTVRIIHDKLGVKITSWRDHGYRHDRNTPKLLKACGIENFSDVRSSEDMAPYKDEGLNHFPINVLPDHDHIFHGSYQEGPVVTSGRKPKSLLIYGAGRMDADDWLETVRRQVEKIEDKGGVATLLVHPACMEICEDFMYFKKLCGFLSGYKTIKMGDAGGHYNEDAI